MWKAACPVVGGYNFGTAFSEKRQVSIADRPLPHENYILYSKRPEAAKSRYRKSDRPVPVRSSLLFSHRNNCAQSNRDPKLIDNEIGGEKEKSILVSLASNSKAFLENIYTGKSIANRIFTPFPPGRPLSVCWAEFSLCANKRTKFAKIKSHWNTAKLKYLVGGCVTQSKFYTVLSNYYLVFQIFFAILKRTSNTCYRIDENLVRFKDTISQPVRSLSSSSTSFCYHTRSIQLYF